MALLQYLRRWRYLVACKKVYCCVTWAAGQRYWNCCGGTRGNMKLMGFERSEETRTQVKKDSKQEASYMAIALQLSLKRGLLRSECVELPYKCMAFKRKGQLVKTHIRSAERSLSSIVRFKDTFRRSAN
jgi:hypothetical protein